MSVVTLSRLNRYLVDFLLFSIDVSADSVDDLSVAYWLSISDLLMMYHCDGTVT